jgi:hypothetical protein
MNRQQLTHRLEFYDYGILDQQVESVANVNCQAVVRERQHHFDVGTKALLGQLVTEAGTIGAFEETGAERKDPSRMCHS